MFHVGIVLGVVNFLTLKYMKQQPEPRISGAEASRSRSEAPDK
jgi:hypothetical protein